MYQNEKLGKLTLVVERTITDSKFRPIPPEVTDGIYQTKRHIHLRSDDVGKSTVGTDFTRGRVSSHSIRRHGFEG